MTEVIIAVAAVFVILLIAVFSSRSRIKTLYLKYLKVGNQANITGKELAAISIEKLNLPNLNLAVADGELIDGYSAKTKTLIMSRDICNTASLASLTIVAHELGHAVQDRQGNLLFKLVNFLNRLTRFTTKLILPLLLVGIFMLFPWFNTFDKGLILIYIAAGLFGLLILVKLLTIPVEYNASHKALIYLKENNFLTRNEIGRAKKLLRVAALTYIASLFDGFLFFGNAVKQAFRNNKKK